MTYAVCNGDLQTVKRVFEGVQPYDNEGQYDDWGSTDLQPYITQGITLHDVGFISFVDDDCCVEVFAEIDVKGKRMKGFATVRIEKKKVRRLKSC